MSKPTVVASKEVLTQEAVLELSFNSGASWSTLKGVDSIPKMGVDISFVEVDGIDEEAIRHIPGRKTPGAFELVFKRIGDDSVQDTLLTAADNKDIISARATYQSGDIATISIQLGARYMGEAARGDNVQMCGVFGQQIGEPTWTKVA